MFTDSHCHVTKEFYDDIDTVLENAKEAGVNRIILGGTCNERNDEIVKLIDGCSEIYGTLGVHPESVDSFNLDHIKANVNHPKIVAIGEIGLDYYYTKDNKEKQKKAFESQLQLAQELNIPVVVHSREATKDTMDILKKYQVKGVIHSFSGSYEVAKEYISMGFVLGINGVVTFQNSNLKEVIKKIPLEYIILETDSPFLTPSPFRGEKNEPKHIIEIAKFIAQLHGVSMDEMAKITNLNIARIFDI